MILRIFESLYGALILAGLAAAILAELRGAWRRRHQPKGDQHPWK